MSKMVKSKKAMEIKVMDNLLMAMGNKMTITSRFLFIAKHNKFNSLSNK